MRIELILYLERVMSFHLDDGCINYILARGGFEPPTTAYETDKLPYSTSLIININCF